MSQVPALLAVFAQLSLLAFGGGNSILPEMQRQCVDVHHWMTATQFASLYGLAQAAPGPNMLVSTLIGWNVGGLAGALAATAGLTGPSSVLTFIAAGAWHRFHAATWRSWVQAGLVPVTVGLIMAGAALLVQTTTHGWETGLLVAVTTLIFLFTRLHPLLILAAATALGATGVLG